MKDETIIERMQHADRIKAMSPVSGVSADAIFIALCVTKSPTTSKRTDIISHPPQWFNDALIALSGQRLTVGGFMMFAGQPGGSKTEKNYVGAWLRASGRQPFKRGGQHLFKI